MRPCWWVTTNVDKPYATGQSYATCGYAGYATVTPNLVTSHGYATYGYAGYATVTTNTVTPHSYATCGYAGYATVTPNSVTPRTVTPSVTPNMVTPHSYARCGYAGYSTVTPNSVTPVTPNTVTPYAYVQFGYAITVSRQNRRPARQAVWWWGRGTLHASWRSMARIVDQRVSLRRPVKIHHIHGSDAVKAYKDRHRSMSRGLRSNDVHSETSTTI